MLTRATQVLSLTAILIAAIASIDARDADACSIYQETAMPPATSEAREIPANGVFFGEDEARYSWVNENGDPIELEVTLPVSCDAELGEHALDQGKV